jgi:hypothetical protein
VTNEIGSIDINSASYKNIYNNFFDDSLTGSLAHVLSVQSELSLAIRNNIENVINPDIQLMTTLYGRLQFIDAVVPDYYRFNYYKYYPHNGSSYDTTNSIFNCPRIYYDVFPSDMLRDYCVSYLIAVINNHINLGHTITPYMQTIKNACLSLVGNNTITGNEGTLYNTTTDSRIQSFFNNFFINTNSSYTTVLNAIRVDPNGDSGTRMMLNLPTCMNVLTTYPSGTSIKSNLNQDYDYFLNGLQYTMSPAAKGIKWAVLLTTVKTYIVSLLQDVEMINFPESLWNSTDGFLSKMNVSPASLDRLVTFILKYYQTYDVNNLWYFQPDFTISNVNPIEYVVLSFIENLARSIDFLNPTVDDYPLTNDEKNILQTKIRNIGNAYLDVGLKNYNTFVLNGTNMISSEVPELFIPENPAISTYHLPYDGITSVTCYLLNNMKSQFNVFFQAATNQTVYDNMGNPFMDINDQFVTETDFYIYGKQMYDDGYNMINAVVDSYENDMARYDKYGNVLKIKNVYLEQTSNMFTYPLKMYIEFHKAIYNDQNIYIDSTKTNYTELYDDILSVLNEQLLPLLQYFNDTYNIYMGPMDVLIESLENRLSNFRINPYDVDIDLDRHNWYNEKIITAIIDNEINFEPSEVGLYQYFLSNINSPINLFLPTLYLYQWYNGIDQTYVNDEINKMKHLFGLPYYPSNTETLLAITPEKLYNDIGNINYKYNGFAQTKDYIKYLMDHIIRWSQLGYIIPLFKATITATRDELISYYLTEKNNSIDEINKINPYTLTNMNGGVKYSTLEDIVRNIYNKNPVNFAWIQELGHYIIDKVELLIDDAVIDQYNGELMHIIYSTEGSADTLRGYKKMIGHVPELNTFNNTKKQKYKLYIPILFTFSKFYTAALPLVSMLYANASIRVKLKNFEDVAYWAPMTQFNKKIKVKCNMIADYIYLDHEERFKQAPLRHEMLIDLFQSNGEYSIDLSTIENNTTSVRVNFNGTSKELFLVCQLMDYIDGSLPNGEKQWHNYLIKVPKNEKIVNGATVIEYLDVNPIETLEINFDGRLREPAKEILYYNCIQRLKHHSTSLYDGINVYSFAISPQLLQPSGSANLGKVGYIDLVIKFREDVMALIGKNKKLMRIGVYNKSINMLRIMSGLAGLAFYGNYD